MNPGELVMLSWDVASLPLWKGRDGHQSGEMSKTDVGIVVASGVRLSFDFVVIVNNRHEMGWARVRYLQRIP